MRMGNAASWFAVVLAVAAAVVCQKLLTKHLTGSSGSAWFDAGCSDTGGSGGADCAAVLASPYSYWPPKQADEFPPRAHIPVAFLGLVYYSVLAVWMIGVGAPSRGRRWWHAAPLLLVTIGLAGSAYFIYVMFAKLNEWCPWCIVTHALNVGIAVCLILSWPRRVRTPAQSESADVEAEPMPTAAHPSPRLALMTTLAVILVAYGQGQMYGKEAFGKALAVYRVQFGKCVAAVDRLRTDGEKLYLAWRKETQRQVPIDVDDPIRFGLHSGSYIADRGPHSGPYNGDRRVRFADHTARNGSNDVDPTSADARSSAVELVVFSDFECPSCRKFALFLERDVEPLFGGHLMTVFKHFPLNGSCNPATHTGMHRYACEAAKLAEAARVVGGSGAFWAAHDFLFHNQGKLKAGQIGVEQIARAANIDLKALRGAAESDAVAERIKTDALEARSLGLRGTPFLFLSGRYVDNIARDSLMFWDHVAEQYWKTSKVPRPASTKRADLGTATPGIPSPPGGP